MLDPTNPPRPYLTFKETISLFDSQEILYVDTETNGANIWDGRGHLNGISIAAGERGHCLFSTYLPFRHRNGPNYSNECLFELKEKMMAYQGHLTFHNAPFDLQSLSTVGIDYPGKFYCTMLMSHLTNENLYSQALDSLCRTRIKREGKKESDVFKAGIKAMGWDGLPSYIMFEYASTDAELLVPLLDNIMVDFEKEELHEVWEHKQAFIREVINPMMRRGVRINVELCKRMIAHGEWAMAELVELLGGINPGSPKDQYDLLITRLGLPILKRSKKTDKPSFDKEVMAQYEEILEHRNGDSTAEYFLAYRGWQKSVSSNYKAYVQLLSPDGRLRPNYKLHGTKTGRLSCELPNLQQIPRSGDKPWNGQMKKCFIPSNGYQLWEADYSQLELRLGTAYAHEDKLLEIFADPTRDVFTEMSGQVGFPRFETKTLTYTMQYGGGATRISNVFGISLSAAADVKNTYFATYPGFEIMTKHAARKAVANGKVQLWSKRYRHFMFPQTEKHKAFNSVIQGGAADIVERTMLRLVRAGLNTDDCRMLLQVHDSVVFEIKEGMEEEFLPKIKQVMEDVQPDFGVKFKVDIHRWGES